MQVATQTNHSTVQKLMRLFDGFTRVSESDLPKEIDMFHLGVEGDEFNRLFKFRDGEP